MQQAGKAGTLTLWRMLGLVWRPLRRLTEETRQSRVALEAIARELKVIRQGLYPEVSEEEALDPGTEVGYTTSAEQLALEGIYGQLSQAKGAPPSEDDVLKEYARQLEMGFRAAGRMGTLGQALSRGPSAIEEANADLAETAAKRGF